MRVVPISTLASLAYCRRQVYLTLVKGVKPRRREIFRGVEQHNISKEGEARIEPEVVIDAASEPDSTLAFPFESLFTSFIYKGFLFVGKPDKVIKRGRKVYVEEEKYVRRSYGRLFDNWKLQLLAYCHSLARGKTIFQYGNFRRRLDFSGDEFFYYVVERNIETREVLCVHEPRSYAFEELEGKLEDFVSMVKSSKAPEVEATPNAEVAL